MTTTNPSGETIEWPPTETTTDPAWLWFPCVRCAEWRVSIDGSGCSVCGARALTPHISYSGEWEYSAVDYASAYTDGWFGVKRLSESLSRVAVTTAPEPAA